jgi:hypothetical protein
MTSTHTFNNAASAPNHVWPSHSNANSQPHEWYVCRLSNVQRAQRHCFASAPVQRAATHVRHTPRGVAACFHCVAAWFAKTQNVCTPLTQSRNRRRAHLLLHRGPAWRHAADGAVKRRCHNCALTQGYDCSFGESANVLAFEVREGLTHVSFFYRALITHPAAPLPLLFSCPRSP